jgi:hypothetical protein
MKSWVIWSEEHGAWWKAHSTGYTRQLSEAGRYEAAKAEEIVTRANKYCEPGTFNEVGLPDPMQSEKGSGV